MARALELAALGRLSTRPNPSVGCVIVRDGRILGEGYSAPAGGPHAEVRAMTAAAGEPVAGATVYVTLEPCSHFGRTPPCADALIRAAPARVVVAARDPHPQVSGGGIERLRAAGIAVEVGLCEAEARAVNAGFMLRHERGRPLLRLKLAASLDGRSAMASGESQWITGVDARRDVQRLRARSCAVVTGSGTVLADDPRLTVRTDELPELSAFDAEFLASHPPLRVILDRGLRTPDSARLLSVPGVLICSSATAAASRQQALAAAGAECLALPGAGDGLDLSSLLALLAERDCNEVLFECGPRLAASVLTAGLVDELWLYQAPLLLGAQARPMADLAFDRLIEGLRFECRDVTRIGDDLRLILTPEPSGGGPGSGLSSQARRSIVRPPAGGATKS
ncbi:MAG: bifunctional diaminohydroxyphosphoribosylaminopyrimidine deaminase/5-amino-6-(5-phosphoribosylamino)uracil reductase RibD [Gammaproteobacteria bacterium]|nr:bifunctional diaminohydroxyphosphoribosylaminopyrimidine deaminase/5-amino-6-(5-phosphoribosylamino)uracil reductase RibD [Gammaproteobacteria bacterium]